MAGRRLLPHREPASLPQDLGDLTDALRAQYRLPDDAELASATRGVAEVVVRPRSPLIGTHLFPGMATPSGDLVVLAVSRGGDPVSGLAETLREGDTLLLTGPWDHLSRHTSDASEVLVVDRPDALRRAVPLGPGAKRAAGILLAMVVLLATGAVPPAVAGLLAAVAVVLSRVLSSSQAYRSVSWTTVVLVGGMIPLSTAFIETGTAALVADGLLSLLGAGGPHVALAALCLLTVVLGQLISNTATVLIVAPIAVSVAASLDLSVQPFMMALTVAAAASFLTPIATPVNLMVMEPGGYRFGDYWKLGLPLAVIFLLFAVLYVPLVWPF